MIIINKSDLITPLQFVLIAMTAIGLKNHVFAISPLVQTAGRDAWMAVLFTMILTVIWVPLLIYINKITKRRSLFVWLTENVGINSSRILAIILIAYLLVMSSVTLRETITWTNIVFLPQTPAFLLTFLFLFTCWHLAVTNLRTLSIINIFLLFFIVVFGFLVAFANIPHKNYSLLLPILEHGYKPIFSSMIYQASGMIELFIFVLLQHKVNAPLNLRHFLAIIFVLTGLTLGPLIGAIIEFGPIEASRQRYPPYEEWGLVRFGNFIEHLDFLSIYQWLAGGFIRVSLLLLLIKEALPVKTESGKKRVLFLFLFIIGGLVLAPISDFTFSEWLEKFILPSTFWFFFIFSLICLLAIVLTRKKRRSSTNEN